MVKVITIMDDVYSDLYRMKLQRGLSFSGLFRELLSEREKKRDIMSFAGSVCDFEVDRHTIEVARKSSKTWERMF
jgi:predicted CopG family antitoxin